MQTHTNTNIPKILIFSGIWLDQDLVKYCIVQNGWHTPFLGKAIQELHPSPVLQTAFWVDKDWKKSEFFIIIWQQMLIRTKWDMLIALSVYSKIFNKHMKQDAASVSWNNFYFMCFPLTYLTSHTPWDLNPLPVQSKWLLWLKWCTVSFQNLKSCFVL